MSERRKERETEGDEKGGKERYCYWLYLLGEERSGSVDGGTDIALDGSLLIDRLSDDVKDTA